MPSPQRNDNRDRQVCCDQRRSRVRKNTNAQGCFAIAALQKDDGRERHADLKWHVENNQLEPQGERAAVVDDLPIVGPSRCTSSPTRCRTSRECAVSELLVHGVSCRAYRHRPRSSSFHDQRIFHGCGGLHNHDTAMIAGSIRPPFPSG